MKKKGCGTLLLVGLAVVVVLLAAAYFVMDREKLILNDAARAALPGRFITLPQGVTHYQLDGPLEGPLVVLVHGFSVAAYGWDHNVPALAQAGFRVLTYDLYGRGYSDRPAGPYTLDFFTTQLDDLLTALGVDRPVDVIGVSMGGYIAADFAARHPERIRKVVLLAPQSTANGSDSRLAMVTLPGIGEYLFAVYIGPIYMGNSNGEFQSPADAETWHMRYLEMMQYAGFRHALLSTLRYMNRDPFEAYRALGQTSLPVLLLWGDQDTTSPVGNAPRVVAAMPQAELHLIPGAHHAFIFEFADVVNPMIITFLQR